jgi:hypothetical protein
VQQHAGSVDDRGVGRVGFDAERIEDFFFEGLDRLFNGSCRHVAGVEVAAEPIDRRAARLHDKGMAVVGGGGLQGGEIEQAMDRRNSLIVGRHAGYSIAPADDALEPPVFGRNGWS